MDFLRERTLLGGKKNNHYSMSFVVQDNMNITKIVSVLNTLNVCYRSRIVKTVVPYSPEVVELLCVLCDNGFISGYSIFKNLSGVCIYFRYHTCGRPALVSVKTISTAGRRVLVKYSFNLLKRTYKLGINTGSILIFLNGRFKCVQMRSLISSRSGLAVALLM